MNRSNYAAERASDVSIPSYEVTELAIEAVTMTYPNGMSREEYEALESPDLEHDDEEEDFDLSELNDGTYDEPFSASTGTFNYGFDPTEMNTDSAHRAFCNNFAD